MVSLNQIKVDEIVQKLCQELYNNHFFIANSIRVVANYF